MMTPRALYACAALSLLFAVLAAGLDLRVALALLLAAISFAAVGAVLKALQDIRDILSKQSADEDN